MARRLRKGLITAAIALVALAVAARAFTSGSLDCLRQVDDRDLLYELQPGTYESDGWVLKMPLFHFEVSANGCRHLPGEGNAVVALRPVLFIGDSMTFGLGV